MMPEAHLDKIQHKWMQHIIVQLQRDHEYFSNVLSHAEGLLMAYPINDEENISVLAARRIQQGEDLVDVIKDFMIATLERQASFIKTNKPSPNTAIRRMIVDYINTENAIYLLHLASFMLVFETSIVEVYSPTGYLEHDMAHLILFLMFSYYSQLEEFKELFQFEVTSVTGETIQVTIPLLIAQGFNVAEILTISGESPEQLIQFINYPGDSLADLQSLGVKEIISPDVLANRMREFKTPDSLKLIDRVLCFCLLYSRQKDITIESYHRMVDEGEIVPRKMIESFVGFDGLSLMRGKLLKTIELVKKNQQGFLMGLEYILPAQLITELDRALADIGV